MLNPAPEEVVSDHRSVVLFHASRFANVLVPQRDLVLDYLIHNCYTSATRAFVRESGVKHVDADGDEVMTSPVKESSEAVDTLEERLAMGELRKGALVLNVDHVVCTYTLHTRDTNAHPHR